MSPYGQRSPAEEQPQQNDYRDRHTQQPQQNSSSHRLLLDPRSGRQRRAKRLVPPLLGNLGQRKRDLDKRVAVSVDGLAHFEVDVGGFAAARQLPFASADEVRKRRERLHQWPVFGIDDQGSAGGFGSPFCNSSIECRSGERMKAMLPSRGGRLMVTPIFISLSQVA